MGSVEGRPTYNSVPVEFSDCALLQVLLCAGYIVTLRQILNNLLSHPTTLEDSGLRVGEAPLQVWNNSIVCRLPAQVVGVLQVKLMVGATWATVRLMERSSSTACNKLTADRTSLASLADWETLGKLVFISALQSRRSQCRGGEVRGYKSRYRGKLHS